MYENSFLPLILFLAAAVATDLHRRQIPNVLVAIMLVCGVSLHIGFLGGPGVISALNGIVVGFLILIPFYALGGLGAGDVKLLAGVGSFLGPWGVLLAGTLTLVIGGILGLAVIFWQRVGTIMAARFLSIPPSASIELDEIKIPYSLAIAAGAIAASFSYEALVPLLFVS